LALTEASLLENLHLANEQGIDGNLASAVKGAGTPHCLIVFVDLINDDKISMAHGLCQFLQALGWMFANDLVD
jgi:hypothetical protein